MNRINAKIVKIALLCICLATYALPSGALNDENQSMLRIRRLILSSTEQSGKPLIVIQDDERALKAVFVLSKANTKTR